MKIKKIRPVNGSAVLEERASTVSRRAQDAFRAPLLPSETFTLLTPAEKAAREAAALLEAENVEPLTSKVKFRPGDGADPRPFNHFFSDARTDLEALVRISDNLGTGIRDTYNIITQYENNIVGNLKTLRDRMAALKLYAADVINSEQYLAFSFTDGESILQPEGEALYYEEREGALMLPVVGEIRKPEISKIEILTGDNASNGQPARERGQPELAFDTNLTGEPSTHTWFEYERRGPATTAPLRLKLRVTFKEEMVINQILINPANLGTANWPVIEDILIEENGNQVSIKSDIATPEWDPTEDPFRLSPAASRFAGEGIFTFFPRNAKAVVLSFRQDEGIWDGENIRHVIGLRNIEFIQRPFGDEGSFLLAEQVFSKPIRALGVIENASPFNNTDASLDLWISTDSGSSWTAIAPLSNRDALRTEALFFDQPITRLLIKGRLARRSEAFQTARSSKSDIPIDQDFIATAGVASAAIALPAKPVNYVDVIRLGYGSVGFGGNPLFLGTGTGSRVTFDLPFDLRKNDILLLVGEEEWRVLTSFNSATQKGAVLRRAPRPQLVFGNGENVTDGDNDTMNGGLPVPIGVPIRMFYRITEETTSDFLLYDDRATWRVIEEGKSYAVTPSLPIDKIKDSVKVRFKRSLKRETTSVGPGLEGEDNFIQIPLNHRVRYAQASASHETYLQSLEVPGGYQYDLNIWTAPTDPGRRLQFVNGTIEFNKDFGADSGERFFSYDWRTQRVYLKDPHPADEDDLELTYIYRDIYEVPEEYINFSRKGNEIILSGFPDGEITPITIIKTIDQLAAQGQRIANLAALNIRGLIKGSVSGIDSANGDLVAALLAVEVDFINGSLEFEERSGNPYGYFSVDYKNSVIHLPNDVVFPATGKIKVKVLNAEIEYGVGQHLIEGQDYVARPDAIVLTSTFLNKLAFEPSSGRDRLLIRYDAMETEGVSGTILEQFYTPVIRDLAIIGVPVDPRLAALEDL